MKKVLKITLIIVGALILFGVIASFGEANTDTSTNSTKEESTSNNESVSKIGEPARDGKFEFIVNKIDCGRTQLGGQFANHKAQGEFCLVDVTIKNIGDQAQSLFEDNQYAFNAEGQKYSADTEASFYLDEAASTIYEEINPGNSVKGKIIFDVPKGTKLVKLELHDSAFSGGVEVNLN